MLECSIHSTCCPGTQVRSFHSWGSGSYYSRSRYTLPPLETWFIGGTLTEIPICCVIGGVVFVPSLPESRSWAICEKLRASGKEPSDGFCVDRWPFRHPLPRPTVERRHRFLLRLLSSFSTYLLRRPTSYAPFVVIGSDSYMTSAIFPSFGPPHTLPHTEIN